MRKFKDLNPGDRFILADSLYIKSYTDGSQAVTCLKIHPLESSGGIIINSIKLQEGIPTICIDEEFVIKLE